MSTKRFRLTKTAKLLLFILIIAIVGGGVFAGFKTGFVKMPGSKPVAETSNLDLSNKAEKENNSYDTSSKNDSSINLSIDEWVGYIPIIKGEAAGIYDEYGVDLNLFVINDSTQSSNALIKGELDGAGYTINRTAFLSNKFTNADVDIVMPYITNFSNGGDGIIAHSDIQNVNDLVGAKIGVPQFTESHAMLVWFVNNSDLSQSEKDDIINNLVLMTSAEETAKAFFAGQIDVAATWQPYLTQAEEMTDAHVLFSTANSTKLIMSGIVFRNDFAKNNPELISKFIDATLEASSLYDSNAYNKELADMMPMFNGMSDESIAEMTLDAKLTTWKNNMDILQDDAKLIYSNMCDVWTSLGETVNKEMVNTVFDSSYMASLSDKYDSIMSEKVEENHIIASENKDIIAETEALLGGTASVTFIKNTAKFDDASAASNELNKFIEIAKILDGTIIEIAGNTDPNPNSDPLDEYNQKLSLQRAETVKNYFVMNGISADRIVVIGNGSNNPIVDNDTEEHRAMNRRTDVSFKCIE